MPPSLFKTVESPKLIVEQVEETRESLHQYLWVRFLFLSCLVAGVLFLVFQWLDYSFETPLSFRRFLVLGGLALLCTRFFQRPRLIRVDEIAYLVESNNPVLGQRLQTTLEFATESKSASPGLVKALIRDTNHRILGVNFEEFIQWKKTTYLLAGLIFLTLLQAVWLVRSPEWRTAFLRMLTVPVEYTNLIVKPGIFSLKEGEQLETRITVEGRKVEQLTLGYRLIGEEEWSLIEIPQPEKRLRRGQTQPDPFYQTLPVIKSDFEYVVWGDEFRSNLFLVTVRHPLRLKEFSVEITPPAYTKQQKNLSKERRVSVSEGTRLVWNWELDAEAGFAECLFKSKSDAQETVYPVTIDGTRLSLTLENLTESGTLLLNAVSPYGMDLEPASPKEKREKFQIQVNADRPPVVRFIEPDETIEVIPIAEVGMRLHAEDDFGLSRMGIQYRIGDHPWETLSQSEFPGDLEQETIARLLLEKYQLSYTDSVTYFGFAEDNYPGGAHRSETELRFIDIRPYRREYKFQESQGETAGNNNSNGGTSPTLEELIKKQRDLLGQTKKLTRQNPLKEAQRKETQEAEEALAARAEEFLSGLVARFGEQPGLEQAVLLMMQAAQALTNAGNPENSPPAEALEQALELEHQALTSLIKGRQELAKILSDQKACKECQKFEREQQQKLRTPEKKPEKSLAEEVRELAKQERELAQKASSSSQGNSPLQRGRDNNSQSKPNQTEQKPESTNSDQPSETQANSTSDQEKNELIQQHRSTSERAKELSGKLEQDQRSSQLAQDRMKRASELADQGTQAMERGDPQQASQSDELAASQLELLSEQISGSQGKDLGERISRARALAGELAREAREVSKSETLDEEKLRQTAERAETLGEWLDRLAELGEESLEQSIRNLIPDSKNTTPAPALQDALTSQNEETQKGLAAQAARELEALAKGLSKLQSQLDGSRLDDLLKAEKQASETQAELKNVTDQTNAQQSLTELQETLAELSGTQGLNQARESLATATENHPNWDRDPRGAYIVPNPILDNIKRTIQQLQVEIHEVVLRQVTIEPDAPVPPEYRKKVDDYFKSLSEDLRE